MIPQMASIEIPKFRLSPRPLLGQSQGPLWSTKYALTSSSHQWASSLLLRKF
jgi:hypothetical protein